MRVSGSTVSIADPDAGAGSNNGAGTGGADDGRSFTFDRAYWSVDDSNGAAATQRDVFNDLGALVIDNSFHGFNASVFAYGQTGSGKTFAMMGTRTDPGVIPLACSDLFRRMELARSLDSNYSASVEVSYLEIYNEVVRDLLSPQNNLKGGLKVREHASIGVYVQGLARLVANSYDEIEKLLTLGGRERTVAATRMNAASSRSHAVLTLYFTQSVKEEGVSDPVRKMSKINLVDLAGSEHQSDSGATGTRMKEACSINKSLSALSNVISALASQSRHVPYRDSILTRLLQESLGGNAKSVMLAAVSPAAVNYAQSLSTLRYANRAKSIVNKPIVNEGGDGAIIRSLKEEIERLKALLATGALGDAAALADQLSAQSDLVAALRLSKEQKEQATAEIVEQRERSLRDQGVTLKDIGAAMGRQRTPYLINLNPDPSLTETMLYYIREGSTSVGFGAPGKTTDIVLAGLRIADEHARFDNMASNVMLTPLLDAPTYVNGVFLTETRRLCHGDRIVFGKSFVFRFADPVAAETAAPQEFGWEDAVREMSSVLGLKIGGAGSEEMYEALVRAAFLADEANDMARSLGKRALFAVDIEPQIDGGPQVAIRSTSMVSGNSTVVPIAAFEDRVQLMYELLVTAETGVQGLRAGDDPFFDPMPDVLVAEGTLDLSPLARLAGIEKTIPLAPDGELEVSLRPMDGRTFAFLEPVPDIRKLYGTRVTFLLSLPAARNLPGSCLSGLFVRYNFPEDEHVEVTDRVPAETPHPVFGYRDRFEMTIDADFVKYVTTRRLPFQIFGRAPLIPNDDAEANAVELRARIEYLSGENQDLLRLNETFIRQLEMMRKQVESAQIASREKEAQWGAVMDDNERQATRIAELEAALAQQQLQGQRQLQPQPQPQPQPSGVPLSRLPPMPAAPAAAPAAAPVAVPPVRGRAGRTPASSATPMPSGGGVAGSAPAPPAPAPDATTPDAGTSKRSRTCAVQ